MAHYSSPFQNYGSYQNQWEQDIIVPKKINNRYLRKQKMSLEKAGLECGALKPKGRKNRSSYMRQYDPNSKSIMKRHSNKNLRVTFADEVLGELVSIKELPSRYWKGVKHFPQYEVAREYHSICRENNIAVVNLVLHQLAVVKDNTNHSAILNLFGLCITRQVVESLEIAFRMVTFQSMYIYIHNLSKETAIDLFEMISFYDPVKELVLCHFPSCFDSFIWDVIANTAKECDALTSIYFRQLTIDPNFVEVFFNTISTKNNILALHFDGCDVGVAPNFNLVCYVDDNRYLREIHLCHTNLSSKEAEVIGSYLARSTMLKVLDLSNNKLGDQGFDALTRGLCEQAYRGATIDSLILMANRITRGCAIPLCSIISNCHLKSINLGYNSLTDVVLVAIKDDVADSKSITSLSLHSTFITGTGLYYLTKSCMHNRRLNHLNLKGNRRISVEALDELSNTLCYTHLTQIELDICDGSRNEGKEAMIRLGNSVKANEERVKLVTEETSDNEEFQVVAVQEGNNPIQPPIPSYGSSRLYAPFSQDYDEITIELTQQIGDFLNCAACLNS